MKNKLCNYFIDRLIKNANNEEIKFILKLISAYFDDISERILGICEILKLLEKNDNIELRFIFLKSTENKELSLAFNSNAIYVLPKKIEKIYSGRKSQNEIILNNINFLLANPDYEFIAEKFIETVKINNNKN